MATCKPDDYLMGRNNRIPPLLMVMMNAIFVVVCGILWYAALDPQANQTGPLLHLTALGFTAMVVFGIPKQVENYHFFELRYRLEGKCVILENKKERYEFDLGQDYLVTRYTFSMGKSGRIGVPMFWLMRPGTPCKLRDYGGISPMKRILRSGGILLPRNATSLVLDITSLHHIPNHPRTVFCKRK